MLSPTQIAAELIEQRQTLLPKRLLPPGVVVSPTLG